jgi:hypothetical protein
VYACGELFFAFCGSCVVKGAESDWAFIGKMTEEMRIRGKKTREKKRERERGVNGEKGVKLCAVGCETSPRPDGATHSEMVPPIIKADLPSLLVLAHGGLANGEAALQPAAFAALQTYPGVGEFQTPFTTFHNLSLLL